MEGVSGIREEEGKTCMPEAMRPKIVCFPSNHAVGPTATMWPTKCSFKKNIISYLYQACIQGSRVLE